MSPSFDYLGAPALIAAGDADQSMLSTRGPDWWADALSAESGRKEPADPVRRRTRTGRPSASTRRAGPLSRHARRRTRVGRSARFEVTTTTIAGVAFGIMTAQQHAGYADLSSRLAAADARPQIEHAWLFDHLLSRAGGIRRDRTWQRINKVAVVPDSRCAATIFIISISPITAVVLSGQLAQSSSHVNMRKRVSFG
jgi:hypothetical protein